MTTTVKVQVNGRYRATVTQTFSDGREETTIIEGNYAGGSGERSFYMGHPADATFKVVEVYMPETKEAPNG